LRWGFLPRGGVRIVERMKILPLIAAALLQGCVVVPRTEVVYHEKCELEVRQITLEALYARQFPGSCSGKDCAYLLAALGLVAAGSVVVSGSIATVGNVLYWTELQLKCRAT
jgi:hypothetical protein